MVLADYDKIANFMNIYAKMDPKSDPKIDVWAIRGPPEAKHSRLETDWS